MRRRLLAAYLASAARHGFRLGEHDCCSFAADWVRLLGHGDPMRAWRGVYGEPEGFGALMPAGGGIALLIGRELRAIGLAATTAPRPGDVGAIAFAPGDAAAAIRLETGWVMRRDRGIGFLAMGGVRVLGAWAT